MLTDSTFTVSSRSLARYYYFFFAFSKKEKKKVIFTTIGYNHSFVLLFLSLFISYLLHGGVFFFIYFYFLLSRFFFFCLTQLIKLNQYMIVLSKLQIQSINRKRVACVVPEVWLLYAKRHLTIYKSVAAFDPDAHN